MPEVKRTLTAKQKALLDYISNYIRKKRISPTYREIQQYFSLASLGSVYKYIQVLKKKGYVDVIPDCARSITCINNEFELPTSEKEVPLIGNFSLGEPLETFSYYQTIVVPSLWVEELEQVYLLQIKKENIIEYALLKEDYLLIEVEGKAKTGDLTLFKHDKGSIWIFCYSEEMKKQEKMHQEYEQLGVIKKVFRSLL